MSDKLPMPYPKGYYGTYWRGPMADAGQRPCDDAEVMRVWRECGLPEYFLGNGGTNHKLVEFARRIRTLKEPTDG